MKLKVSPGVAKKMVRTRDQFRVDTFRAGGKGGQNQNKVESGVRMVDLVTGIQAEARDGRDQLQNREKAFFRLAEKVRDYYEAEERNARIRDINPQLWIRSYHEPRGVVVDRRAKGSTFDYKDTLDGELEPIHAKIQSA